ncbi:Uma2 family endonuclease [Streptomyces sp. NPDC002446]
MTISLEQTETIASDVMEMAEPTENEPSLDELFEWLERAIPEGHKIEIIGGAIFIMSPQRATHWEIILDIVEQLRARYPRKRVLSDVRIDFPGRRTALCCDVVAISEGSEKDEKGRWRYDCIDFVAEVISKDTAANDYGPKKDVYALAEVPVYVISDPYTRECRVFTDPQNGKYTGEITIPYGDPIDLTNTVVGLTLSTDDFPRD